MHIQHGQDAQTVEGVEFAEMNQAFLALFFLISRSLQGQFFFQIHQNKMRLLNDFNEKLSIHQNRCANPHPTWK